MSIQRSEKKLDDFTPKGYLGCVLHVRTFWTFPNTYIYCGWAIGAAIPLVEVLSFVCERDFVRVKERERREALCLSFLPSKFSVMLRGASSLIS